MLTAIVPALLVVVGSTEDIHLLTEYYAGRALGRLPAVALERMVRHMVIDLVLLDIVMPGMDGYEVCRRLKEDLSTRDIPVLFITAMGDMEGEEKGLEPGAADYISKPIGPAIVKARVGRIWSCVRCGVWWIHRIPKP